MRLAILSALLLLPAPAFAQAADDPVERALQAWKLYAPAPM